MKPIISLSFHYNGYRMTDTNITPNNEPPKPNPPVDPVATPAPSVPVQPAQCPPAVAPQAPQAPVPTPQQPAQTSVVAVPTQPHGPATTQQTPQPIINPQPENKLKAKDQVSGAKKLLVTPLIALAALRNWSKKHSGLISLMQLVGGPILLVVLINAFVFQPYQVFGSSMSPTLHEKDRLIINKLGKSWANFIRGTHTPKRGDVIVFKTDLKDDIQLIKRVIGLPGEKVVVKDGTITIFNEEFPDGFNPDDEWKDTLPNIKTGNQNLTLSEDEIFVSGDNRTPGGSLDSRNDLGPVPLENVIGELIFRMFPLDDAKVY